jgi:hypothetical protein
MPEAPFLTHTDPSLNPNWGLCTRLGCRLPSLCIFRVPEECCGEVAELMDRCLAMDEAARPSSHELVDVLSKYLVGHMQEQSEETTTVAC